MKQLAFLNTFDYELYLGKNSGTAENCMLKPTELLLRILREHQLPSIFFIDATYLFRLREMSAIHPQAIKDYDSICFQLSQIKKQGHKIYLHLHPHWIDGQYNPKTNKWNLGDKSHFSLSSLDDPQREEVFSRAYSILAEITGGIIEGFRAGGLYAQPFSFFHPLFRKHGIKYEFSVLRGAYSKEAGGFSFDFKIHPEPFAYRFEEDLLKKKSRGAFIEFSVNTVEIPFTYRIANRVANKLFSGKSDDARFGDGAPSGNRIYFHAQSKNTTIETLGIENLSLVKAQLYFAEASKHGYIHLLSHPKLVSVRAIEIYNGFLEKLKRKFEVVTDLNSILKMQAA